MARPVYGARQATTYDPAVGVAVAVTVVETGERFYGTVLDKDTGIGGALADTWYALGTGTVVKGWYHRENLIFGTP